MNIEAIYQDGLIIVYHHGNKVVKYTIYPCSGEEECENCGNYYVGVESGDNLSNLLPHVDGYWDGFKSKVEALKAIKKDVEFREMYRDEGFE